MVEGDNQVYVHRHDRRRHADPGSAACLPETSEARQLAKELLDYEIRVDELADDLYGAFKVGAHDDLVTAVGLAVHQRPQTVWFC